MFCSCQKHLFLLVAGATAFTAGAQTIASFQSVMPTTQTQSLVLPATHRFQRIIKSGDALSAGGNLGNTLDFTGYVPIAGSSVNGYLSVSSETFPAEVAVLNIAYNNGSKLWAVSGSGKVPFPGTEIGVVAAFCSGTVTPNGTVMVGEEAVAAGDSNGDGYEDLGWLIEIDPATRTVINQDGTGGVDKLWAMGRNKHENVVIAANNAVAYWGGDDASNGFMCKFVATVPGNFSAGALYVLQTTAGLGTGTWQLINNTTQADRNNTIGLSTAAGAYNFNRIEDIEIGPDGKVYFATTTAGTVLRFRDLGTSVEGLEVFVASTSYDVDGAGPFPPEPWGVGVDNLAFDGEGNLWALQDGGNNHIWVVGANHTAAAPNVRLFATTPFGSEPTGITFSPDYKFLFLSIQHPDGANAASQADAAGASVLFNTSTTLVIARAENLGANITLPLRFMQFAAQPVASGVALRWTFSSQTNSEEFEVERSADGLHFAAIGKVQIQAQASNATGQYLDAAVPANGSVFWYRIKSTRAAGPLYSRTEKVQLSGLQSLGLYPVPVAKTLSALYQSEQEGPATIQVRNASGALLYQGARTFQKGRNPISIDVQTWPVGRYFLTVQLGREEVVRSFVKE